MIIFDVSKRETHHPNANYTNLSRRLRSHSKVQVNKESINPSQLKECELLVIASPQSHFSDEELRVIKEYVNGGGSLAVVSSEGGTQSPQSNVNELTQMFGIGIDKTTLVRTVYCNYLHPKHALIQNGIVQPEIGVEKSTPMHTTTNSNRHQERNNMSTRNDGIDSSMSLSFVYPNGTTLSVRSPAYTLLSSGSTSYPVDCPIAAAWESTTENNGKQGRVIVVGSSDIFADQWIEKEENSNLCNVLFRFLLRQDMSFDPSLGRSDFEEIECVPDISSLAQLVKPCLQENDPLPQDYQSLICDELYGLHNDYVPEVIGLYKKLNVPFEPLTLVEPQFECPHPPFQLATHPPQMMDPPPPALELFDLDECFSDIRARLSKITNRYSDDDSTLDEYLQEAGSILEIIDVGLDDGVGDGKMAKGVLNRVVQQVSPLISSIWKGE